jgi:hypothetical protein
MILWISLVFVVMSPFSSLILLIWVTYLIYFTLNHNSLRGNLRVNSS